MTGTDESIGPPTGSYIPDTGSPAAGKYLTYRNYYIIASRTFSLSGAYRSRDLGRTSALR